MPLRDQLEGLAMLPFPWRSSISKRAGLEDWIKRILIGLACLWLTVGVLLPLVEVIDRAVNAEVVVVIEEPTEDEKAADSFRGEVRAAGRSIVLIDEARQPQLFINNKPVGNNGQAAVDGVEVEYSEDFIERIVCRTIPANDSKQGMRPIRPLEISRNTMGLWTVEGSTLPLGNNVRSVKRFIGLENFMNYFGLRGMSQRQLLGAMLVAFLAVFIAGKLTLDFFLKSEKHSYSKALTAGVILLLVMQAWRMLNFLHAGSGHSNLAQSAWNSLSVAVATTTIAVTLAFIYAYGITRTCIRGKLLFRIIAMLPLFAPTMLYGLSLVYLFGNQGVITTGFFGKLSWLSCDIGLYGFVGIVLAEIAFTFPPAMMILNVALANTDARLYEAAASLGAGPIKTFFTVTLPNVKYGLLSALFVCFTLSFTDFGAPKIVGGRFNVLAVDIYKQVIGQQNFGMGATVSIILLVPTLLAFFADRIVQRRSHAAVTARSVLYRPSPARVRDGIFMLFCSLIALFILALLFMAGIGSLVTFWPYAFTHPEIYPDLWTFKNYLFETVGGGGYSAFFTSIRMSAYTAVFGTAITFVSAYLIEKTKGAEKLRQGAYFLSIVPLALPGLVIGISYVFFFNRPSFGIPFTNWQISNPFTLIYGTMAILVLCNIIHFYTVSFLTATTALRQLDKEFEMVSESMAVPFYRTFFRVTVPVCFPAIVEIAAFYFVSSMATVSGVIFLYNSNMPLASVAVINMDDAGDTAAAAAMCMLIVLTNITIRGAAELAGFLFARKTQVWRKR